MSEHRYEGTWKLPDIEREQEGILFIDSEKGIIRLKLLRLCIIIVNSNNVKSIKWIFVVINFY